MKTSTQRSIHFFTECRAWPTVPNSKFSYARFGIPGYFPATPGTLLRCTCVENYAMFGAGFSECLDDLSWTEVGTCLPGEAFEYLSHFV